ncbi:AMP-binding protein [Enhygromyxa salina]|uniref:AMP-binding protein n=1 Tax=Enhygromyxa salina TaxID=215803 RepID=UPI000D0880F4|nr:AMP-binding protein [Enhygromyxa salina]
MRSRVRSSVRRLQASASNAKELVEFGRLGDPWGSPYEVVHESRHYRLRRYASPDSSAPSSTPDHARPGAVLLVPPLMVTSEVYDVSPDTSAVGALTDAGLDVWLVDYGAPEREAGGLERTLDDHVLAIDDSIARIVSSTGRPVHLVGYSQGGMFCYQAAAYRRCEGIASLVTFGSPVDIHSNLPAVDAELGGRLIGAARRAVAKPLAQLDGLPGVLTSTGFKVLSLRKELQQISEFLAKLHDRDALIKRESRRRFLGGEGFVAWPGPALRTFVDEFIVANRMSAGGFVIAGRTASLAELDVPILCFYGERDELARAASVRAIVDAAPAAEVDQIALPAGHFGLVVGSTAMRSSWPTVAEWVMWRDCAGPRPGLLEDDSSGYDEIEAFEVEAEFEPIIGVMGDVVGSVVGAVKDAVELGSRELGDTLDDMRYQLPRLRTLERLDGQTRVNLGLELSDRAARHPDRTFFLWQGRAFSYAEADRRVDAIVRGLIDRGVELGMRVGVLMDGRPTYLSVVAALNRLGAVAVLFKPRTADARGRGDGPSRLETLSAAIAATELVALIADPPNAADAVSCWRGRPPPVMHEQVLVLGGGHPRRSLPEGTFDMETIAPELVELPDWYVPNPGRAADIAMTIVTTRPWAAPREANISNGRWAVSAYGAAATCLLSSRDTVYCVLPLHHPAGMLVAVGGALVGRARLALARDFDAERFWSEVRRYGATVVFYAGEMCRALVQAPRSASEGNHSLRMLAGSGMRAPLWRELVERFGPIELREFYASTEGNLVLANITGKRGALGRPLPGSNELAVVAYDFEAGDFVRDASGHARRCRVDEAGLLIAKVGPTHPRHGHEGEAGTDAVASFRRDVFGGPHTWFVTGDIVRRDAEGDFWYVDRTSHLIRGPHGWVASRQIEDALYEVPGLELVVVYGLARARLDPALLARVSAQGSAELVVATVVVSEPARFDADPLAARVAKLRPEQRPSFVRLRTTVALTDGFRPLKTPLVSAGLDLDDPALLVWDPEQARYRRLGSA